MIAPVSQLRPPSWLACYNLSARKRFPGTGAYRRPAVASTGMASPPVHEDIANVLFSQQDIQSRVAEMGKELSQTYRDRQPLVLGVQAKVLALSQACQGQRLSNILKLP